MVSTAGCLVTIVRQRWEMPVYRGRESGVLLTAMPGVIQSNVSPELRGRLDCPRTRLHGRPQSGRPSRGAHRSVCRTRSLRGSCHRGEREGPCRRPQSRLASCSLNVSPHLEGTLAVGNECGHAGSTLRLRACVGRRHVPADRVRMDAYRCLTVQKEWHEHSELTSPHPSTQTHQARRSSSGTYCDGRIGCRSEGTTMAVDK